VARDARTTQATVRVRVDQSALRVEVEDRGIGFDPDAVTGAGIVGMRERVAALGGTLDIISAPDAGVTVTATLPLASRV
jgi:signal transduction histidine kinase